MTPLIEQRRNVGVCSNEDCSNGISSMGMCATHYNAMIRDRRKVPCPSCDKPMSPSSTRCRECRNSHPEKLGCKQCGLALPVSEFRRAKWGGAARTSWSANCNSCTELNTIIRGKLVASGAGDVRIQLSNLRARAKVLGIPWADVATGYPEDGRCQSCGRTQIESAPNNRAKNLCLDHCHGSNALRGFLCSPCNVGIGALGDTAERLAQALAYLTKNNGYWSETA